MELFRQPIVDHALLEFMLGKNEIKQVDRYTLNNSAKKIQLRLAAKTVPIAGKRYEWQYLIYFQLQNIAAFLKGETELKIYEGYGDVQND